MPKVSEITHAERVLLEELLKKNHSRGYIAKSLGRALSTISLEVKRSGGKALYCASEAQKNADIRREPKRFSQQQIDEITTLIKEKKSIRYIANHLGVNRARTAAFIRQEKLQVIQNYVDFIDRIEALEYQVNFLHELITEIKNDIKN